MEHYFESDKVKKLRFLSVNYSNERLILKREYIISHLYLSKIYKFENIRIYYPDLLINEQKNTIEYLILNLKKLTIKCNLFSFDEINRLVNFNNKSKFILLNRLHKLKTLRIMNCSTFEIFKNKLNNLDNLEELYINVNHFGESMNDFFNNLTSESQIKKLLFISNDSNHLSKDIFDKLSNLEILIIKLNYGEIGDIFGKLNNLKALEIACSNFNGKSNQILNLPSLKILNIDCLDFDELKHSFDKLVNLEMLSLQIFNFRLHNLDNVFGKLTNLKSLSFYFPNVNLKSNYEKNKYIFDELVKLERLSISCICIVNLENSLNKLINLKILKIVCNEFNYPLNEIFNELIVQNKLRVVKIMCYNEIFLKEELNYGNLLNLEKLSINSHEINKTAKGNGEINTLLDKIKMS